MWNNCVGNQNMCNFLDFSGVIVNVVTLSHCQTRKGKYENLMYSFCGLQAKIDWRFEFAAQNKCRGNFTGPIL